MSWAGITRRPSVPAKGGLPSSGKWQAKVSRKIAAAPRSVPWGAERDSLFVGRADVVDVVMRSGPGKNADVVLHVDAVSIAEGRMMFELMRGQTGLEQLGC